MKEQEQQMKTTTIDRYFEVVRLMYRNNLIMRVPSSSELKSLKYSSGASYDNTSRSLD